ncbi:hypothetical protein F1737_10395 [Methanoplanus sp. FWC-SCC4]|uniref:Uncharacterized protein n=1 Tax=Methanochimaera problematica TaxID=2609417 RepID=A0AA97FEG9_9EURY|nr:hypothetical protein [Methanoplanus sp. FWC-SCC4]WOF17057.1 hypothetical protein F1737_10395 [Methanoplanus sp. FWC-SCC4]
MLAYSYSDTTFGFEESRYEDIYAANGITPPKTELKRANSPDFFEILPEEKRVEIFGEDNFDNIPFGRVIAGNYVIFLIDTGEAVHAVETDGTNVREYDIEPVVVAEQNLPVAERKTGDIEPNLFRGYKINRIFLETIPGVNDNQTGFVDIITVFSDDKTRVFGYDMIKYHIEGSFYGNYDGNMVYAADKSTTWNAFGTIIRKSMNSIRGPGTMSGEISLEEEYQIPSIPFSPVFTTQSKVRAGPYGDVDWFSHSGNFVSPTLGLIGLAAYLFAFYICSVRVYKYFFKREEEKEGEEK